jgi:soluble lytic murein transglycosylase
MFRRLAGGVCIAVCLGTASLTALSLIGFGDAARAAPQASGAAVQAAELAFKGRYGEAGSMAQRSGDQAAVKLVELLYLRDHWKDAGYDRIMAFLNSAPKWPLTETLTKRAEQALYKDRAPAQKVLAHFADRKPLSPEGKLALARAKADSGATKEAQLLVKQVWADADVPADMEQPIIAEFGGMLSNDDMKRRMWRMVFAQATNGAVRNAKRLGGEHQQAAKVALALLKGAAGADKQYSKLPAAMREQMAMKFALARYFRRQERFAKARAILVSIPESAVAQGDPKAWWTERRIIARRSVGPRHADAAKAAYKIAASHGMVEGAEAVEGEFLAGWIALRSLDDAQTAMRHFSRLAEIAPTRTEKARANYWVGRALASSGDKGGARRAYDEAAQYSTIYYGQLARERIGLGKTPEPVVSGQASAAAKAKVAGDEVIRAMRLVAASKNKQHLHMFVWPISTRFNSVDEMNAAAEIVQNVGSTTMALRLAKAAGQRNIDIDAWGYPTKALPNWTHIGHPVERSLVFALSRQESEFDPRAGSKVGAQGLMQLMPGTAKLVARQYRLPYAPAKLTGDPSYNVRLGAAHLADLVNDYNGSYVLTLVAYNAGPRRVREWVAEYGDPRGGKVDPIDWVESIPFQETRQYVQKVLQNVHIYRSRLAPNTVKPMTADLMRGAPQSISVAATVGEETASTEPCAGGSIGALIARCE